MRHPLVLLLAAFLCFSVAFVGYFSSKKAPPVELVALTTHETNARDFEFDGLSFKTTEAELQGNAIDQSLRILREIEKDKKFENLVTWKRFGFQSETADNVEVDFYEGQLVGISVWYYKKKTDAMGGVKTLVNRLVNKFGDSMIASGSAWVFLKVSREISLNELGGGTVVVHVQDPGLYEKARNADAEAKEAAQREAQRKAKTGLE